MSELIYGMVKQIVTSQVGLLALIVTIIIGYALEGWLFPIFVQVPGSRLDKNLSKLASFLCFIGGAIIYAKLFGKPGSVEPELDPAAVLWCNGLVTGFIGALLHEFVIARRTDLFTALIARFTPASLKILLPPTTQPITPASPDSSSKNP